VAILLLVRVLDPAHLLILATLRLALRLAIATIAVAALALRGTRLVALLGVALLLAGR